MVEVGRLTAVLDVDDSKLTAGLAKAKSQATSSMQGIEQGVNKQLSAGLAGAMAGGWGNVGKTIGQDVIAGITAPFGTLGSVAGSAAQALGPTGIIATAALAGTAAIAAAATRAAMAWDAGMAGVSKTTGIDKGTQAYKDLSGQLKDLYATMPNTRDEVLNVAKAAGSLGIEKDSIAGFTQVALQMGSAFDMPAEEAATAVGKIKSQLKSLPEGVSDSADFAKKFGSAVDVMGNEYNATEKDILDFSTRVAGSMSSLGAGAYDVAGWGAMLSSVFPSAERAAGSFDALLTQLTTNEDSQAKAAELLGVSTDEFMQSMSTDPSDTLLRIGKALEGLPADKLISTTKALGGAYGMDALVKMVGHTEEYATAIKKANDAGAQGTSIGASYGRGIDNLQSQLEILKNEISATLTDIGGPIAAALTPAVSGIAGSLNTLRTAGEQAWSALEKGAQKVGSAINTGKAYVTAFVQELASLATSIPGVQELLNVFDQLRNKLQEVGSFVTEIAGKIAGGLADAIPKAISGATGAVGSLIGQGANAAGLGGVLDAAGGFWSRVQDRSKEILQPATEESVEKGTEEGMKKGAEKAKPGITSAVTSAFQSAQAAMDAAYKSMVDAGVSKEIASARAYGGIASDEAALALLNRSTWQSGGTDAYTRSDLTFKTKVPIKFTDVYLGQAGGNGSRYTLNVGGKEYSVQGFMGRTEAIKQLFDTASKDLNYDVRSLLEQEEANALNAPLYMNPDFPSLNPGQASYNANVAIREARAPIDYGALFLDPAKAIKTEMEAIGQQINDNIGSEWMDQNAIDNAIDRLNQLKKITPLEFAEQGGQNYLNYLKSVQDALDRIAEAEYNVKLDPDNDNFRRELQQALADGQVILNGNPLKAKIEVDSRALEAQVMDAYFKGNKTALRNLGISNVDKFFDYNQAQEKAYLTDLFSKGMAPTEGSEGWQAFYDVYASLIDNWGKLDDWTQDRVFELGEALHYGGDYWLAFGKSIGATDTALSSANDTMERGQGILKKTAESLDECCDLMSDFGWAQEEMSDTLFNKSYIGQTGEQYQAFLDAEKARGAYSPDTLRLGKDYSEPAIKPLELDDTSARNTLTAFNSSAKETVTVPLHADGSQAMGVIGQIRAAAAQGAFMPIYSGAAGGGGGLPVDIINQGIFESPLSFPGFGIGDVFVPEPTLAVVGDRPGGEWIGGIDQAQARFGGRGNITIDARIINYGTMSSQDLDRRLDDQRKAILAEVGRLQNTGGY